MTTLSRLITLFIRMYQQGRVFNRRLKKRMAVSLSKTLSVNINKLIATLKRIIRLLFLIVRMPLILWSRIVR